MHKVRQESATVLFASRGVSAPSRALFTVFPRLLLLGATLPAVPLTAKAAPDLNPALSGLFEQRLVAVDPEGLEQGMIEGEEEEEAKQDGPNKFAFFSGDISPLSGSIQQTKPQPIHLLNPISGETKEGDPQAQQDDSPEAQKERIVREFGSPDDEIPILGDEKAPKPFRGMMHALESGNKELAFQYARSYVRYMNKVKERSSLAAQLAGLGAEIEGTQPRRDHSEEQDTSGYLGIYKKELGKAVENESAVLSLNPEAQELLARARGETLDAQDSEAAAANRRPLGEAAERALVHENHPGGLPVDPNGRVSVYYFLSVADKGPHSMLTDVQRLYDTYAKDQKVRVVGISLVSRAELGVSEMRYRENAITLPIEENKELAASFGIVRTPAVVVVAETDQRVILEKGHRTFWYLDELVRTVGGRRSGSMNRTGGTKR